MKLNGWQRLWILCCLIYGTVGTCFVVFSINEIPQYAKHKDSFYSELSSDFMSKIAMDWEVSKEKRRGHDLLTRGHDLLTFREFQEYTLTTETDKFILKRVKNSHTINFKKPISEKEMTTIITKYNKICEDDSDSEQINLILVGLIFWFIPCVVVYLLGFAISWIIRGFKESKLDK